MLCHCALAWSAPAAPVWRSDFSVDGNADGMVVLRNGPSKNQFSGPASGLLTITNWDNTTSAYIPDKAGRPLGVTKSMGDSFSGLCKFRWSTLNTTSTEAYEVFAFLGDATPQTRQTCGAILRHWRTAGVYFVALDIGVGSVGNTNFGYKAGSTISLGSGALSNVYQLALGYNGLTHALTLSLYSSSGTLLTTNAADLDTDVPGLLSAGPATVELGALALTHLGWGDYTGNGGDRATVWQVDYLSYFDTATGAADAVEGAAPTGGACCMSSGACMDGQVASACTSAGGTFQGAGTECSGVSCPQPTPGACCAFDGSCSLTTQAGCTGFWQGVNTTCGQVACTPYNPDNEPWEVQYTGLDSAADNVANWLRWDSPIDDDWNQSPSSYQLNTPSPGFMSVDRVTNVADQIKTGNIWIRDPILSHAAGVTMEVRVLIKPNSNTDAYSITYLDNGTSFGVHLSPNRIKAGDLAAGGGGTTVAFNTTDAYHLYRIVHPANSQSIAVHVDNNPTPILTGTGNTNYITGSSAYLLYPRILIGDNENNTSYNANYTLDFARYRRGATAPGQTPPTFPARVLPALPSPAPPGETWTMGYDGTGTPATQGWIEAGGSNWFQQPGGVMELNGLSGPANARKDTLAGWSNRAGLTLEARIRVMPDSQEHAFNLVANDQVGATALVLSPGKAGLMHAYLPVGMAVKTFDTTSDFHTYRLTRDPDGIYWHLYIDNNPAGAILYQHAEGDLIPFSRLWFGDIGFPTPANNCHVLIDYIRYHEGANAPPVICTNPTADADGDGDVDQTDFGTLQRCLGPIFPTAAPACVCFDRNVSGSVDPSDFNVFLNCMSGADTTANPACDD